jgi:hypothetical protein
MPKYQFIKYIISTHAYLQSLPEAIPDPSIPIAKGVRLRTMYE